MSNSTSSGLSYSQGGESGYVQSSDAAELNHSAASFSSYVKEASAMPEVRSEVVDLYKSRIRSGHYPSQDIVAGLTHLIGGSIAEQTKSAAKS